MTLIVAIKCDNGIVMGSDGAIVFRPSTFETPIGQDTVAQQVRKLNIAEGKMIVGGAGLAGLCQDIYLDLEKNYKRAKGFETIDLAHLRIFLRQLLWNKITGERDLANQTIGLISQNYKAITGINEDDILAKKENMETLSGLLARYPFVETFIALPFKDKPILFQMDGKVGDIEEVTENMFAAIGSGEALAHYLLSFIKRFHIPNRNFSVKEAKIWIQIILHTAIKDSANKFSEPIQICTLLKEDGTEWIARELEKEELIDSNTLERKAKLYFEDFIDFIDYTSN